jgi:hypothetical protein
VLVTVLAIVIISISLLLVPISFISLLMILSGQPGSSTWDPKGFFFVIIAPALTVAGGVALLMRMKLGWVYIVALFCMFILSNIWELATARESTTTTTLPSGVLQTTMRSGPSPYCVPIILVSGAILVLLMWPGVRAEFFDAGAGDVPSSPVPPPIPPPIPHTGSPRDPQ